MKKTILCALALGLSLTATHADTFGSGGNAFAIDFATIGNAGNADDSGGGGGIYSSPYGGVPYVYRIAVTEVPQDSITKATALGMTNVIAGVWTGLRPAARITWYEAAAFVNWLNTSTGHQAAYQLDETNTALTLWGSAQAWQLGGENLYRHKDAYYFLPSEDEWYKAAYHKNDGVTANYWDYATVSNGVPVSISGGMGGTTPGTAVYNSFAPPFLTDVDNDGGLSPYGTRGQNGNVMEWQESAFDGTNDSASEFRAARGGSYLTPEVPLRSSERGGGWEPDSFADSLGFRIASVPEPSSAILILSGSLLAFAQSRSRTAL